MSLELRIALMTNRKSSNQRGPGARRFDRLLQERAPKKLEQGDQLLYEHALRCLCNRCGRLLDWHCPEDASYTETECCGQRYVLQPWTVRVAVEDVSSRPLLPKMDGSNYSDPDYTLTDKMTGDIRIDATQSKPLSKAQRDLKLGSHAQ